MTEAQREERRAEGAQIAADAPRTVGEQVLSIQARLRPAHRTLRRLQRIRAQAVSALWPCLLALRTLRPLLLALGLDHLDYGYRMAREEVYSGRRRKRPRL